MSKFERVETVKNALTDEVISKTSNVINIRPMEAEPAFIKLYIDDLGRMLNLQHGHKDILLYIAASVDYEGIVSLASGRKQRIAATVGCSTKSVDNAIWELVKQGLMSRIGRGEYLLDPNLFAKGEWRKIKERRASFQAVITYSQSGRKIETKMIQEQLDLH